MNDLQYIFYRARDMYLDTIGMSKEGKVAHRQLADYTWINDGPPVNDNDVLREITSCLPQDWGRVKRELIGKGWVETPNFFLHRGIIKTLNYSKEKAVESYNRACAISKQPRRELQSPDPETGVTLYVTQPVTTTNREGEGKGEKREGERAREDCFEIPDFEMAFAQTQNAAIPRDFCWFVFEDWISRGGKDAGGVAVSWLPYVTKRWSREQVEWRSGTHKGSKSAASDAKTGPSLSEVRALVKEKFGNDPKASGWAASFHAYWSDSKRQWKNNGRSIDWKIELSRQCAKWREEKA